MGMGVLKMSQTKSAWDEHFLKMYGRLPGQPEKAHQHLMSPIARDAILASFRYAPRIINTITKLCKRAKFSENEIKYLFWVLFKDRPSWPVLPPNVKHSLTVMLWLLTEAGGFPNFTYFTVPDMTFDYAINNIIKQTGEYVLKDIIPKMKKEIRKSVKTHAKKINISVPNRQKPSDWLYDRFIEEAKQRPHLLFGGDILGLVISLP